MDKVFSYTTIDKALLELDRPKWHWAKAEAPMSLPDFIKLSAQGEAKMIKDSVFVKKPGPDPVLEELLAQRMAEAQDDMIDAMSFALYGIKK